MPLFETAKIQLDGEDWAEIKELSVGELQEADAKGTEAAATLMRLLPEKIIETQMERTREAAMDRMVRFEGYDVVTLVRFGLTAWSYKVPCDAENVAKLGAKNGEVIARAIFELSVIPSGEARASSSRLVEDGSSGDLSERTTSIEREAPSV